MKNFQQLIASIEQTHWYLQGPEVHAVNQALAIRNWLIRYFTEKTNRQPVLRA